ncbi:hypothetical protein DH2020_037375 [Rehmannia glutinosa]|uniref:SPX domain-containing protein n=1 Tax=Rehmannia glutinosa TaxID=99300 RepID=A0ABR0V1H9_REHGL
MKFGKEFRIHLEETLPEWRDKYLSYKPLKKLLKNIPVPAADNLPPDGTLSELQEWFVGILNEELEKFNDFYVDKEEDFIIRLQALKERIERLKARGSTDVVFTSETEFSQEMMEIRKDFVAIHGEMVLLKNYSSLNFAVRDCEANLEVLFPLEAEVVESAHVEQNQTGTSTHADVSNASRATTLPLGEETVDIYRSTLAAIKAIQGLKKASSTYNPMSSVLSLWKPR